MEADLLILVYYLNPMQWSRQLYINFPCLICRLRNILLKSEQELPRNDHSELVGEGIYVTSKKTIGKVKVQVRKVKMGTEQPTGCMFTSLKSSSTVKLETFQQRLSNVKLVVSSNRKKGKKEKKEKKEKKKRKKADIVRGSLYAGFLHSFILSYINMDSCFSFNLTSTRIVYLVFDCRTIFLFVEIEKFTRRGCIGNVTGICLPDGFGDDLIIEVHDSKGKYCGHALVQVADISDESVLDLEMHTQSSGIMNVHCWLPGMAIYVSTIVKCILAFRSFRYLSYVMDISTATVDYLDLVHDILLPVVIKDKSPFSGRRLAAPALDPALKLYKWLHDILSPRLLREKGNWYAVLSYDASVLLSLHSWARSCMGAPPFLENECSLLRDVLGIIFLFVEIEKFARRGCIGNVTGICLPDGFGDDLIIEVHDSNGKYCGHALVQVADISDESVLDLDLIIGFLGISIVSVLYLGNQSMKKLGKIQLYINYSTTADESSCKCIYICSRNCSLRLCFGDCDERPTVSAQKLVATCGLGNWYAVLSYDASVRLCLHSWARSCMGAPPFLENECSLLRDVLGIIFMFVEIEKFTRRGCFGNVTGICLPDGFGDDLIIEVHDPKGKYCGHALVQVADISDESVLDLEMHTQSSGIMNVHCWLPGMAIYVSTIVKCILAFRSFRYLSYVMDISTATVDYLDLVHDILLPVVIKDKSPFSGRRLAAPALDPALKLYKWLHDILSPSGLGNWYAVLSYDASVRLCLHSWARSCMGAPPFLENECSLLRDVLGIIFMFVEIEKFTRRGCFGNVTGICLPDGFGDDLIIEVHDPKGKYCGHALVQVADIFDESVLDLEMHTQSSGIMNVHCWLPGMAIYVSTIVKCILAFRSFRYLSYVMDISTATVDYLDLVHDILLPVVIKDKSPFSGRRLAAPALDPALKLYKWLHDILSPRSIRHLFEIDEFFSTNNENMLLDPVRLESIESVTKILEEANKPILPAGTGDLFGPLKGRPHDSNNIFFIIATLSTIGALTTTMDCQLRSLIIYMNVAHAGHSFRCLEMPWRHKKHMLECTMRLPYIILSNAEIGIEGCRDLFKWLSRRQLAGLVSSLDEIKLLKPTASAITDKLAGGCKAAEACFNEIVRGFMDKKRKRLKPYGALQDNYESGRSVSSRLSDLNRGHSLVKIMQVIAIATTEGFKNEAKNMLVASGDIEHTYVPTQHLIRLV
ncbi:hypothetical protein SASPL_127312 [Salvia splendens]|uniref:Uncharacterized protein n=1 Tax=Salvia splendens TaxID=180675 RepID=A0A8X8XH47_SALSN|nr:hypothetical protein SASPL_127312 [Salvia splendens]